MDLDLLETSFHLLNLLSRAKVRVRAGMMRKVTTRIKEERNKEKEKEKVKVKRKEATSLKMIIMPLGKYLMLLELSTSKFLRSPKGRCERRDCVWQIHISPSRMFLARLVRLLSNFLRRIISQGLMNRKLSTGSSRLHLCS